MTIEIVRDHFAGHQRTVTLVAEQLSPLIVQVSEQISAALHLGNKVLLVGNGGSAADAQHFAAELVGRFLLERRALPAIALTTDTSILTAVGNDYGFDEIFARQVEALAAAGDLVLGISTSGHSANVIKALAAAQKKGCQTVGLLGRDGGRIAGMVDLALTVPSQETPRIQEAHQLIIHIICDLVEKDMFREEEQRS